MRDQPVLLPLVTPIRAKTALLRLGAVTHAGAASVGPGAGLADEPVLIEGADLSGQRAIVTGAGSGIGTETARALASAGAEVVMAVRRRSSRADRRRHHPLHQQLQGLGARRGAVRPGLRPRFRRRRRIEKEKRNRGYHRR